PAQALQGDRVAERCRPRPRRRGNRRRVVRNSGLVSIIVPGRTHGSSGRIGRIGQKLIEKSVGMTGGYLGNIGTPTSVLLSEIQFADNSIGKMVAALNQNGLYQSTLIVIS